MDQADRRRTNQREVMLEELRSVKTHPTADEIYEMVKKRLPKISLGTVYRNLEVMSSDGLIRRIDTGDKQRRYDAETGDHYHIKCEGCGRVDDVFVKNLDVVEDRAKRVSDYEVTGHRLMFMGLCPKCKRKKS